MSSNTNCAELVGLVVVMSLFLYMLTLHHPHMFSPHASAPLGGGPVFSSASTCANKTTVESARNSASSDATVEKARGLQEREKCRQKYNQVEMKRKTVYHQVGQRGVENIRCTPREFKQLHNFLNGSDGHQRYLRGFDNSRLYGKDEHVDYGDA
jgi:hypothetical protein